MLHHDRFFMLQQTSTLRSHGLSFCMPKCNVHRWLCTLHILRLFKNTCVYLSTVRTKRDENTKCLPQSTHAHDIATLMRNSFATFKKVYLLKASIDSGEGAGSLSTLKRKNLRCSHSWRNKFDLMELV